MEYTVGRLGRQEGISRSTLLYYDAVGLLKPSGRSRSGYRLYTEQDAERLRRILLLRGVGVPLADIAPLLPAGQEDLSVAFFRRLGELNREIEQLQSQQQVIIRLLHAIDLPQSLAQRGRGWWMQVLRDAGLDEDTMRRWHADFEQRSPQQHRAFLQTLGFTPEQIEKVCSHACKENPPAEQEDNGL